MIILSILLGMLLIPLVIALALSLGGVVIAMVIGAFMLIMVMVIKALILPWFEKRDKTRLDENHILLLAQRQEVRLDRYNTINGMNPYVIDCYYRDETTGREFVFTSEPFLQDPSPYLGGVTLGIFVNAEDYSNYYVDTSKLDIPGRVRF